MPEYIAQFQARYEADSDAEAMLIADSISEVATKDFEDSDSFDIVQVVENIKPNKLIPQEAILRLTLARNDLIKTGFRDCWLTAKELDKIIHALRRLIEPGEYIPDYDHGQFTDVAHAVLNLNRSPVDVR